MDQAHSGVDELAHKALAAMGGKVDWLPLPDKASRRRRCSLSANANAHWAVAAQRLYSVTLIRLGSSALSGRASSDGLKSMTYSYEFDDKNLGDLRLRRGAYETVQGGLRLLRDELEAWNRRALEHGALSRP